MLLSIYASGAKIDGHVYDAITNEKIMGAVLTIKETKQASVTDVDVAFLINKVKPSTYTISISFIGYQIG